MIDTSYILALSNKGFVSGQLLSRFGRSTRRESFWRAWGLPELPLD